MPQASNPAPGSVLKPLYSWRGQLIQSELDAGAKHVGLTRKRGPMPAPAPTLEQAAKERRARIVSDAVSRANSNVHRTREHAEWCRHLQKFGALKDDHVFCLAPSSRYTDARS